MKDPCATCSGLTLTIGLDGEWILEAQATLSAKILLSNSTTPTTSRWSPVLINSWWRYNSSYSGIHQYSQQERFDHFLGSQLLLSMRKHGGHHGRRREPQADLHPIRPCSQKRQRSAEEESAWLFPLNPHFNHISIVCYYSSMHCSNFIELCKFMSASLLPVCSSKDTLRFSSKGFKNNNLHAALNQAKNYSE